MVVREGPGNEQSTTAEVHAISYATVIKRKHKNMVKPGKCFGGIPMGILRKVTYLVEAESRAGKERKEQAPRESGKVLRRR